MIFTELEIPGVWTIEPKVLCDDRGYFMEAYKESEFTQHIGPVKFVQENESFSGKGVLRGLHYQLAPYAQAKLVRVMVGEVLDVAVDVRIDSPTFGKYVSLVLSGENKRQLYIPQGFAHGFKVMSETALFKYMVDNPYCPDCEAGIRFDDPSVGIDWGVSDENGVVRSEKDEKLPWLKDARLNMYYK